jgi:DNA-binding winged helix-turn-helix (wHTH) protein
VTGNKSVVFKFADVEVREREFRLVKAGEVLPVEPKAFRVLLFLLRNPQKLIAKEELLNAVWGDAAVTESSLTRTIAQLRRLLGDEIRSPRYIETVATVGYRFLYKVEVSDDVAGDLQAADKTNGLSEGDFVGRFANGEIADAAANPVRQADRGAGYNGKSGKHRDGGRKRLWKWVLPGTVILAVGLATAIWYLRRPLPPLRVTEYAQITHDGRTKLIAGTDGSRLYLNIIDRPHITAQVAISGGEITQLPVALPLAVARDVSPDGSTLLVASFDGGQGSLWNVEIPAGSLRRLLPNVLVQSAVWSPDGKSVVYSLGDGDIYFIRNDGTGTRKLAAVGGLPDSLSWSPDGSKIRFSNDGRLWEMLSDGSRLHPLLPGWRAASSQCCGRWTPDGKFFVFLSRDGFYNSYVTRPGSQVWFLDERRGFLRRPNTEPVQRLQAQ